MNGEDSAEVHRARPLSAGLWTLFSWLRREDHSSTDSLSSVGSARTATSFAFHSPTAHSRPKSSYFSPPSPSSDTYRKRVRDRSLRRQHDRDLTLHKKYGLYRDNNYDVLILPPVLRGDHHKREDRERRAHSECFQQQRRIAYVPGKRRAPQPPILRPNTLPRRHSRKRPAPQPPTKNTDKRDDNEPEQNTSIQRLNIISNEIIPFIDAVPVSVKQENQNTLQDSRNKHKVEKSFLKQLFESKKRYPVLEFAPGKILPSISELDKQAAEIIESCKLKPTDINYTYSKNIAMFSKGDNTWFCTKCLRKFNSTVVTCTFCLPLQKNNIAFKDIGKKQALNNYTQTGKETPSNNQSEINKMGLDVKEKQKLKEMLKEMKKSLPKRAKQGDQKHDEKKSTNENEYYETVEAPTLKIGSTLFDKKNMEQPSSSKQQFHVQNNKKYGLSDVKSELISQGVLITQPVVLIAPKFNEPPFEKIINGCKSKTPQKEEDNKTANDTKNERMNYHEPLKISSLLNPVYIPKIDPSNQDNRIKSPGKIINEVQFTGSHLKPVDLKSEAMQNLDLVKPKNKESITPITVTKIKTEEKQRSSPASKNNMVSSTQIADSSNNKNVNQTGDNIRLTVEQHSRRRDLINKLEQSIAKGDERAAAEAAIQLAQLRLNCSVLSFSSQIAGSTSKNAPIDKDITVQNKSNPNNNAIKSDTKIQKYMPTSSKGQSTSKCTELEKKLPSNKNETTAPELKIESKIKEKGSNVLPSTSTSSATSSANKTNTVPIEIWVEDKEATRGPIYLHIWKEAVLGDLRHRADVALGVAPQLQRWIVGRTLCTDETTPLASLAGLELSAPFYLYLVEADKAAIGTDVGAYKTETKTKGDVYIELMQLEQRPFITNTEPFECGVCMDYCVAGAGAVLRECVHEFCRQCLSDLIRHSEEPTVTCPAMGCHGALQEREIRALVSPANYERWLARGLAAAESGTRNSFHCRTSDCTGWALCEPGVRRFPCPVCKTTNCVPCQAIHEGETCEQYQAKVQEAKSTLYASQADEGTQALLNSLIAKGEALQCPECSAVITKKWGCDWVKCSACKTEICWVTHGRRWGPAGRGDTSGGCRCGVDGKKCHPSCGYCH